MHAGVWKSGMTAAAAARSHLSYSRRDYASSHSGFVASDGRRPPSFASLLIQNDESLAYVRDQLGHSPIQVRVDIYGHLVHGAHRGAVDRLDAPVKTAAFNWHPSRIRRGSERVMRSREVINFIGRGGRIRTGGPLRPSTFGPALTLPDSPKREHRSRCRRA